MSAPTFISIRTDNTKIQYHNTDVVTGIYLNKNMITGFVNVQKANKSCLEVYAPYNLIRIRNEPASFTVCEGDNAYHILMDNMVVREK